MERLGRKNHHGFRSWLHDWVRGTLIHRRWSPDQIACKLRVEPVVRHWVGNHWQRHPDDPTSLISHESKGPDASREMLRFFFQHAKG